MRSNGTINLITVFCSTLAPVVAFAAPLHYLDEGDPYYVSADFPKLTTPQWIGEDGVEAAIVLAIDDMNGHERWETYLRPILERLKQIDGRSPLSIMTCRVDPAEPHLQRWLAEGLSLETHTIAHPCPLLQGSNLQQARATYEDCVDLLGQVPGNRPVAFRMPCCDSINSASPRFYAEIFNRATARGGYLSIDSSVFNLFTPKASQLPRDLVLDASGSERFRRYLPPDRTFVNTIENYPYPYVIGRRCWEFPCSVPSDWEAQHVQQPANPQTIDDMRAAIDATVALQGVYCLVFHPYDWIRNEQVIQLIDHAVARHGQKVKFLSFREALDRLNANLLADQPLRSADGQEQGVRILDLNGDGYLDVILGTGETQVSRVWSPQKRRWASSLFPLPLVRVQADGPRRDSGVRFGSVRADGAVSALMVDEHVRQAWTFNGRKWVQDNGLLRGLEIKGQPAMTTREGLDQGFRLRDLDADGRCECLLANDRVSAAFAWDNDAGRWRRLRFALPKGAMLADAAGRDAGCRFVDVDEDGQDDVVFSNETRYGAWLFTSLTKGWSRALLSGVRGGQENAATALPPFTVHGENFGAWFHSRHIWWQNEITDRLPDHVDRRAFDELLADVEPAARPPQAALRSMVARPGFTVELVASEPLLMDPVAMAWGADGRLWVVEMADYPLGVDGQGKHGGRVRYLEDADGDGRYDQSTLFLDGLGYPSGVMPWNKGVLITCAPEILYAEDTDGDGRADIRQTLYRGFGEGNQQHRVNGLRWGLDNWIYCANGDSGGEIESVVTGDKIDLSGRDFRIRPATGQIDAQTGQTQFSREQDDWGNWFGSNNSNPMFHFVLADHYLRRNPHLTPPDPRVQVSVSPGAAPVFPLSRTLARFNDHAAVNRFTSACSSILYRDDLFGPEFEGNSFVSEPVHNLVHREILAPSGVTFSSRRADDERQSEFLASRDHWFRPTMLRVGPDGALWVADMYRQVIEHPEWIPKDWQQRLDLRAGQDKGRIYRVFPTGKRPRALTRLDRLDTAALVAALDSPSGWQRDMVQQLLVERQDAAAAPFLAQMLADTQRRPTCRLQALCALDGLSGAIAPRAPGAEALLGALGDPHPAVRRHAIRIAEPLLNESPELAAACLKLISDTDPQVRLQLAYSLGACRSPEAGAALAELAVAAHDDPYLTAAALSSVSEHNLAPLLETALAPRATPPPTALVGQLLALAAALDDDAALAQALMAIGKPGAGGYAGWQWAALGGLLDALDRRQIALAEFIRQAPEALKPSLTQLEGMFQRAHQAALDVETPSADRLLAIALLGRGPHGATPDLPALADLLSPRSPGGVQSAAIAALRGLNDPRAPEILLASWPGYAPEQRSEVLEGLLSRAAWVEDVLDAIEAERLPAAEIDAVRRQRLLEHADPSIRKRATAAFAGAVSKDRQQVIDSYRPALRLEGSASAGAEVFKKSCSGCHRLSDVGHALGPDLAALTNRSAEALLVAVLDPNRAVESKFISYTAITTSGVTHTGMLESETGQSITLLAAEGKRVTLLRSELEELASASKSLMPEGVEKDLSPQNVADLFQFLSGFRPPRKQFDGNRPETVTAEALRGEFWLLASNCEIYGTSLIYEPRYGNLGYWSSADDHAVWMLEVNEPGKFKVTLEYACDNSTAGQTCLIEVAGQRLLARIQGTGNWDTYHQLELGQVDLPAGKQQLVARPQGALSGPLLDLKAVRLRPAGK